VYEVTKFIINTGNDIMTQKEIQEKMEKLVLSDQDKINTLHMASQFHGRKHMCRMYVHIEYMTQKLEKKNIGVAHLSVNKISGDNIM